MLGTGGIAIIIFIACFFLAIIACTICYISGRGETDIPHTLRPTSLALYANRQHPDAQLEARLFDLQRHASRYLDTVPEKELTVQTAYASSLEQSNLLPDNSNSCFIEQRQRRPECDAAVHDDTSIEHSSGKIDTPASPSGSLDRTGNGIKTAGDGLSEENATLNENVTNDLEVDESCTIKRSLKGTVRIKKYLSSEVDGHNSLIKDESSDVASADNESSRFVYTQIFPEGVTISERRNSSKEVANAIGQCVDTDCDSGLWIRAKPRVHLCGCSHKHASAFVSPFDENIETGQQEIALVNQNNDVPKTKLTFIKRHFHTKKDVNRLSGCKSFTFEGCNEEIIRQKRSLLTRSSTSKELFSKQKLFPNASLGIPPNCSFVRNNDRKQNKMINSKTRKGSNHCLLQTMHLAPSSDYTLPADMQEKTCRTPLRWSIPTAEDSYHHIMVAQEILRQKMAEHGEGDCLVVNSKSSTNRQQKPVNKQLVFNEKNEVLHVEKITGVSKGPLSSHCSRSDGSQHSASANSDKVLSKKSLSNLSDAKPVNPTISNVPSKQTCDKFETDFYKQKTIKVCAKDKSHKDGQTVTETVAASKNDFQNVENKSPACNLDTPWVECLGKDTKNGAGLLLGAHQSNSQEVDAVCLPTEEHEKRDRREEISRRHVATQMSRTLSGPIGLKEHTTFDNSSGTNKVLCDFANKTCANDSRADVFNDSEIAH